MNVTRLVGTTLRTGCLAFWLAGVIHAQASVVLAGTRVIYNADESEATLKLSNEGKLPALVQSWIDAGDAQAAPSTAEVPFTVAPPIARIDPARGQTLRIVYTGEPLPQDKESVFWLNVLEIPPKPGAADADVNKLQLAFRSRIKLFFRPAHLKGSAADAPEKIDWHLTQTRDRPALVAHNPTPYHVSLILIQLGSGEHVGTFDDGIMIGPGETRTIPLKGDVTAATDAKVHYRALNDFGGAVSGDAALTPGSDPASR
jgi:chaperone protein EcpD